MIRHEATAPVSLSLIDDGRDVNRGASSAAYVHLQILLARQITNFTKSLRTMLSLGSPYILTFASGRVSVAVQVPQTT